MVHHLQQWKTVTIEDSDKIMKDSHNRHIEEDAAIQSGSTRQGHKQKYRKGGSSPSWATAHSISGVNVIIMLYFV